MKLNNFIAAMIAMLIGGPLAWEFLDRTPPFEVIGAATAPQEIKRGQEFHIQWVLAPHTGAHCPGTVYRYIRDSAGIIWSEGSGPASFGLMPMQFGKTVVVGSSHVMPDRASLGAAEIYIRATYVCNFTQNVWPLTMIFEPIKTTIVE